MRRLIRADLRRILAKPGFYICPLILFALFVYGLFQSPIEYDSYYDSLEIQLNYLYPFLVLLPIFTCVYGDELKSGTMVTAIGRGLSRTKVILAKFIDTLVLSLTFCLFFLLMDQITFDRFSVVLTKVQILRVLSAYLACWLKIQGFCAFAAIFVYLTWNSSVGVIAGLIGPGAFSGFTRIFQVLWTAAGCALLLAGGYLAGRGRRMEGRQKTGSARAQDEEIQQTFLVDQARIWHILQGTLLGADHSLETARELFAGAASEGSRDASGSLKKTDLQFFCDLLENAYALRRQLPQDAAIAEQVESIRYYLHERGIETVDYSRQDGKRFELLPGDDEAVTIRPAFLQDSVVVMRGIASGH